MQMNEYVKKHQNRANTDVHKGPNIFKDYYIFPSLQEVETILL